MRELKFRAWDKEMKTMLAWEEIKEFPMQYLNSDDGLIQHMQFTGLKDKNGKEIYEGDILSNGTGRTCVVVWFGPAACFDANVLNADGNSKYFNTQKWYQCEVIGNICKKE